VSLGSLWTTEGRDAASMEDINKGILEMDKAVKLAPQDITLRLVRGINSIYLPSLFNRIEIGLGDFNYLLAHSEFQHFDARLKSTIYCWAGIAYKADHKNEKAKDLLNKAFSVAPNSENGKRAEQELKEIT
jgi:tetratricopeptide (TPR) repeat protein